jgi:hypothetical protein
MTNEAVPLARRLAWFLPLLALLVTGCPQDEYIVELTPRGTVIERKLVFYREDGVDTNGAPTYQSFPLDELALIKKAYPASSIEFDGHRRTVTGEFTTNLPSDIGGAGSYGCLSNSLGTAAFYMERLRGDEDIAASMAMRSPRIDQFVNLIIGWSRAQFGGEKHYRDLRKFLDEDFRHDLHNAVLYAWLLQSTKTDTQEEFAVRLGQYLVEHGYLKLADVPLLLKAWDNPQPQPILLLLQNLLAAKLQIPVDASMPLKLKLLADPVEAEKSWTNYLATTDVYQERMRAWHTEKIKRDITLANDRIINFLRFRTNAPPPAIPAKPDPAEVATDILKDVFSVGDFGRTPDHAIIKLSLAAAPTHSNGKWNEAMKQVVWETNLEGREGGNKLPAFCYANWCQADEKFQIAHFGKVAFQGDALLQYSLWRAGLSESQATEWESLLVDLKPDGTSRTKLDAFRFSGERPGREDRQPEDEPRTLLEKTLFGTK